MKNYLFSAFAFALVGLTAQESVQRIVSCAEPTGIQVQRLSDSDAWISTADNSAEYDLYIKPAGQPAPTAATPARPGFSNLTLPLFTGDLVAQFGYDLYLRTNCSGDTSDWVGPIFITNYEACSTPTITIDRTSDTEASFTALDTNVVFDYYVVLDGQAGPAAQDWFVGPNNAGANDVMSGHSRNDLAPQFGYDVYFRKQCNDTQVSDWIGPIDLDPYVEPCVAPTADEVIVTRTSHTTATFDGANPAFTYQGTANRAGRPLRPRPMYGMTNMTLPHTQNGLIEVFDYDVWFRTDCGDGTFSDWSQPFYIPLYEEEEGCTDAQNVTITRTGDHTGVITADNTNQTYDLFINFQGEAGPSTGDEPNPPFGSDDVTFPLTRGDLGLNLAYDVWVRTECEDGTSTDWTGPYLVPATVATTRVSLSPNPAKDIVTIEGINAVSVQVVNITGKTELNTKVSNNTLNVSNLTPGQYILNVTDSEGKTQALQLIKK